MILLVLMLPWLLLGAYFLLMVRPPRRLSPFEEEDGEDAPFVSVIVPARNEARNIVPLLESLAAIRYPRYEIIVVDDRSTDATRELAAGRDAGNADSIRVVEGEALPPGWFGKPWACHQGYALARGDLLLFTDADTVHHPEVLARSVRALEEDEAAVVTLIGRQVMKSFWERLLQPQFFMLLGLRYPRNRHPKKPRQWRDAIANGQYLLFRRDTYEALGTHEVVKGEVAEDLRLAQLLVKGGWRLSFRLAAGGLETRMYQSLPDIVEGWSKNAATGALQSTPGWLRPVVLPLSFVIGVTWWIVPPVLLVASFLGAGGELLREWSFLITGSSALFWAMISFIVGTSPLFGLLYPVGGGIGAYIFLRSWMRGSRIEWKGREYRMELTGEAGRGSAVGDESDLSQDADSREPS